MLALLATLLAAPAPLPQATTWSHLERFEASATLSVDGDTAAIGSGGAVRVLVLQAGVWTEQAVLSSPFTGGFTDFGESLSVSGDRLAVGAPDEDQGGGSTGAAYVFVRSGSSWSLEQQFSSPVGDGYAGAVALDGDTLMIGRPGYNGGGFDQGAVEVFDRSGSLWSLAQTLVASNPQNGARLGQSLSVEGTTLVAGAPSTAGSAAPTANGRAYVFTETTGTWNEQAALQLGDQPTPTGFGWSVALSVDTLVIGAPWANGEAGAAAVFVKNPNWQLQAQLQASAGAPEDRLGWSVALEGDTALVGAPNDDLAGCVQGSSTFNQRPEGSASLFRRSGSSWSELARFQSPDPADNELFGQSVELLADSVFVAAPGDSTPLEALAGIEGMASDPLTGAVFGTDTITDELVSIDSGTGQPTAIGPLGYSDVRGLAFDPSSGHLYGSDVDSDQLLLIDATTGAGTAIGALGFDNVEGLGFDPVNGLLYGAERPCSGVGGELLSIDVNTGAATSIGSFGTDGIRGLAFHPVNGQLFGLSNSTYRINVATGAAINAKYAGFDLRSLAAAPSSGEFLAADRSRGRLWNVDRNASQAMAVNLADDAHAMASDPNTGTLYAVDRTDDRLAIFDPDLELSTTYVGPVGSLGFAEVAALAFDPSNGKLYGSDVATGQLIEIAPATGQGTAIGPIGFGAVEALALDPATGVLYGSRSGANTLISIDKFTGAGTLIGNIGADLTGLAPSGTTGLLHGIDTSNMLFEIDTTTGAGTPIAVTIGAKSLAFDAANNRLAGTYNSTGELLYFNPSNGSVTLLGSSPVGSVHRFAIDLSVNYCTAGTSASGCQASLSAGGTPSASASEGFLLSAAGVEGGKDGLFFYGTNGRQANPWGNGTSYQCVAPPVQRAGLLIGSGAAGACDGSFAQDLNARWCPSCPKSQSNPGAGGTVQAQLWYRDPASTSNQTTSLSDAIEFVVGP